jgi:hypothetical protein
MNPSDQRLTEREQLMLKALMAQREVYKAGGHHVAARAVGVALWIIWQIAIRMHEDPLP